MVSLDSNGLTIELARVNDHWCLENFENTGARGGGRRALYELLRHMNGSDVLKLTAIGDVRCQYVPAHAWEPYPDADNIEDRKYNVDSMARLVKFYEAIGFIVDLTTYSKDGWVDCVDMSSTIAVVRQKLADYIKV